VDEGGAVVNGVEDGGDGGGWLVVEEV